MRTLWKGAISFGLVNIPVKVYAATERKDVKFNYLHGPCRTPIRYRKWCPSCRREVEGDDIVWGYEYEKGRYVILGEEDFERIPISTARTVNIIDFVKLEEIDPIYFDRTYFLEPADGASKAYALLRHAMQATNRIALAKVTLRSKESLAAVRIYQERVLVLETMFYPDEIRSAGELAGIEPAPPLHENEIKMAETLIGSLSDRFEPEKYTSGYREALLELIRQKIEGKEIAEVEQPETTRVVDLMEALRASIRLAEEERSKAGQGRKDGGEGREEPRRVQQRRVKQRTS